MATMCVKHNRGQHNWMSEYSLNLVVVKLNGEMCLFERKNGNAGLS